METAQRLDLVELVKFHFFENCMNYLFLFELCKLYLCVKSFTTVKYMIVFEKKCANAPNSINVALGPDAESRTQLKTL
jgi:hypothetical protein